MTPQSSQLRINIICKECDRDVLFFMNEEAQKDLPETFQAGCDWCKQSKKVSRDGGTQIVYLDMIL